MIHPSLLQYYIYYLSISHFAYYIYIYKQITVHIQSHFSTEKPTELIVKNLF